MKGGYRPNSGRKKGSIPWNKGKPSPWASKNGFKKGNVPWNAGTKKPKVKKPHGSIGRKLSEEHKEKIRLAKTGIPQSDEAKRKNREGQIRRHLQTNPNYKLLGRNKRIAENGGFHSQGEWETLKAQYNWTCPSCNRREPEIKLTKDHIISLIRGGSNNIENIQPLCMSCNLKKYTNSIKY